MTASSNGADHVLRISDLHATVSRHEILRGVDLEVRTGEVHALMGPNGSGKSTLSHALMGSGEYEVTRGSVTIDGEELLGLPTWQRAHHGLFLAMQYPVEVPGVPLESVVGAALEARGAVPADLHERIAAEARAVGVPDALLRRGVNTEFSGGEKKRAETVQLAVLEPRFAVLDEIDSGLDVDALRDVARRVYALAKDRQVGVLAITHYARLLAELRPDRVHVFLAGRIVKSGGPELADELERTGYEGIAAELGIDELTVGRPAADADPFGDPTIGSNPFADPLA
ncbi:MAG: FeS assembly ATPase SufC [Actinomycetia bacterium]|jgi:Fe-S cluster assembly ATP-binding protein|nr:FeS assembly ATPase SufC [Actinomycetes bacterium]